MREKLSAIITVAILVATFGCSDRTATQAVAPVADSTGPRPSFSYGDEGTYPQNPDGSDNTSVDAALSSAGITLELYTGAPAALYGMDMYVDGWFNMGRNSGQVHLTRNGQPAGGDSFDDSGEASWSGVFSTEFSTHKYFDWANPECGVTETGSADHWGWWRSPLTGFTWGTQHLSSVATPINTAACAAPHAHFTASGGSYSTVDGGGFSGSLAPGTELTVYYNGAPSEAPAGVRSYAWTANGSSAGSSETGSIDIGAGTTVLSLSLTDSTSTVSNAGAELDLYEALCPDGSAPIIGGCQDVGDAGQPYGMSGGFTEDDGTDHGGGPSSVWVCYVTDWYQIDGAGNITYIETDIDYCDLEAN